VRNRSFRQTKQDQAGGRYGNAKHAQHVMEAHQSEIFLLFGLI
jgi:hypothetical protein